MWFSRIRALQHGPARATSASRTRPSMRALFSGAAASAAAVPTASKWLLFGGGLVAGAGASTLWSQQQQLAKGLAEVQPIRTERKDGTLASKDFADLAWFNDLSSQTGVREVLSAGQMFRQHPITGMIVEHDHLFDALVASGQIEDIRCFFNADQMKFHCVVRLGPNVCGYPQTVHGGLTATIVDETFGGLSLSLWQNGQLGLQAPGYTARLEMDYKQKVPSSSVILCTCEVEKKEDRKLWMHATVSDGRGQVYSEARALFVSPRIRNVLFGWLPFFNRLGGKRSSSGKSGGGGNRSADVSKSGATSR